MSRNPVSPAPTHASKEHIHEFAERVALAFNFEAGEPIEPIVAALGGHLEYSDLADVPAGAAAAILVRPDRSFSISLLETTSPQRDRFSIAHELGHFFLHYPMVSSDADPQTMIATRRVDPSDPNQQRAEWEANWFAAAFLMPAKTFTEKFNELGEDLASVARLFDVSQQSATIRAQSLGILS